MLFNISNNYGHASEALKEKLAELKENVLRRKAERANEIDTDIDDEDEEEVDAATAEDDEPTVSDK